VKTIDQLLLSLTFVAIAITKDLCSQIIRQKSALVMFCGAVQT
jgi:hypothetical protein